MGLAESLRETYQRAAKEVKKKTDDFWAKHKAKAEWMLKQVEAGKISMDDYKDWLNGQVFIGKRWKEKLDDITQTYVDADEKARKIINNTDKNEFVKFANIQGKEIKNHVAGYSFDLYDKHTVERLLKEDPKLLPEWHIDKPKDYRWNKKRVQNEITQGIIQGEDIPTIAKRLTVGLAADNDDKMLLFARTAITGAQNAGRISMLHEAQEKGIVVKKKWLAAHDNRVRDAHAYLDGQTVDVDDDFVTEDGQRISFPGDPSAPPELVYNCRCTLTYVYDVKASRENLRENESGVWKPTSEEQKEEQNAKADYFRELGATVDKNGNVTLYHATTKETAKLIYENGFKPNEDPINGGQIEDVKPRSFFGYDKKWIENTWASSNSEIIEIRVPAYFLHQAGQNTDEVFIEGWIHKKGKIWLPDEMPSTLAWDRRLVKRWKKRK